MKDFLLYIWQLPQNLVGLIVLAYCKLFLKNVSKEKYEDINISDIQYETEDLCKRYNIVLTGLW